MTEIVTLREVEPHVRIVLWLLFVAWVCEVLQIALLVSP